MGSRACGTSASTAATAAAAVPDRSPALAAPPGANYHSRVKESAMREKAQMNASAGHALLWPEPEPRQGSPT